MNQINYLYLAAVIQPQYLKIVSLSVMGEKNTRYQRVMKETFKGSETGPREQHQPCVGNN